jgi:polyferredoxin
LIGGRNLKIVELRKLFLLTVIIITVIFIREGTRAYNIGIWQVCPLGAFQDHILLAGKVTLIVVLSAVLLTLVLGRVFCGWLCPFGALMTFLSTIPSGKILFTKWFKHLALLSFVGITVYLMTVPVFCSFCPAGSAFSLFGPAREAAMVQLSYIRYAILGAVVLGTVSYGNLWCTSLCPLGGGLSMVAQLRLFRLNVGPECTGCGKCDEVCEMNIKVSQGKGMEECTLCWNCVEICPYKDIRMGTIFS